MDSVSPLLMYLAIGALLTWGLRSRRMTGLRRFVDRRSNASIDNLGLAKRVAAFGDTAPRGKTAVQTRHPATIGVKALGLAVCGMVLAVTFPGAGDDAGGMQVMGPDLNSPGLFAILLLLSVPYLIFLWRYEVTVSGASLSVPTWWFTRRSVDLTTLDMVEEDGAYGWRLYFRDGRRVEVLKYLTGRAALLRHLQRYVELNRQD